MCGEILAGIMGTGDTPTRERSAPPVASSALLPTAQVKSESATATGPKISGGVGVSQSKKKRVGVPGLAL